jgi:hypothetical protein
MHFTAALKSSPITKLISAILTAAFLLHPHLLCEHQQARLSHGHARLSIILPTPAFRLSDNEAIIAIAAPILTLSVKMP